MEKLKKVGTPLFLHHSGRVELWIINLERGKGWRGSKKEYKLILNFAVRLSVSIYLEKLFAILGFLKSFFSRF
jgi:hypothetical protein